MYDFRSTEYASESSGRFQEMDRWEIWKDKAVYGRRCLDVDPGAAIFQTGG